MLKRLISQNLNRQLSYETRKKLFDHSFYVTNHLKILTLQS